MQLTSWWRMQVIFKIKTFSTEQERVKDKETVERFLNHQSQERASHTKELNEKLSGGENR